MGPAAPIRAESQGRTRAGDGMRTGNAALSAKLCAKAVSEGQIRGFAPSCASLYEARLDLQKDR